MNKPNPHNAISQLESTLTERYGMLVGGRDLWRLLGYSNGEAFRQAIARATVPVPVAVFKIEHRRGHFARVPEIARWLASVGSKTDENAGEDADVA